jgi:hypothetical protein
MRKEQLSFRINSEKVIQLKKLARQEHRTLSEQIVRMIDIAFALKSTRHIPTPAEEEQGLLDEYFPPGVQHGVWSPTDAYEAAANLQRLIAEDHV